MGLLRSSTIVLQVLVLICAVCQGSAGNSTSSSASLIVDASAESQKKIPETLFGIFFEEINHAGAGGLWAELVSNRGFEAGGQNTPSSIEPWSVIGQESQIVLSTDQSSQFKRNQVALRMDVLCGSASNSCPQTGVGVYNPGFWGMNIEEKKSYKVTLYVRAQQSSLVSVSLTGSNGSQVLASSSFKIHGSDVSHWRKIELLLVSQGTDRYARLELKTKRKGVIWFDQVSVMPTDTYKGHGFRKDLYSMLAGLKPRFIRFPGGCFVEGERLRNAFRWRASVGPWEERPGHFGDVWMYWTDDALGYYEFLQLAEDLGAAPIWVFNNGISHKDEVEPSSILPFVWDVLNSIEFARGDASSKWGSVRAAMGHPEPFPLEYVAIGNEDCGKQYYQANYLRFYNAIKAAYPDIKMISNCDASSSPLDHPADMYDFHIYANATYMFDMANKFDNIPRTGQSGPKAFVSEYAVFGNDAGNGTLVAAIAEAAFLIGLERNSDVVDMASYAPIFVNVNDRTWSPDAIVFDSWQHYGTPSYWMQQFFADSSGAMKHPVNIQSDSSTSLISSAITWEKQEEGSSFLKIKVVNFGNDTVNLNISVVGLPYAINSSGSTKTVLTGNRMDENTFDNPNKVVPVESSLENAGKSMAVSIPPLSLTSFDLLLASHQKF